MEVLQLPQSCIQYSLKIFLTVKIFLKNQMLYHSETSNDLVLPNRNYILIISLIQFFSFI